MLNFNDKDLPKFVKVKRVNISALPSINTNLKANAGGYGVLSGESTFGEKVISADVSIVIPSGYSLQKCARELAVWLQGNNFKLSPLIISDDAEVHYMAKISNSVSINDLIFAGEGTIEFVVPSGVAVGNSVKSYTGTTKSVFTYEGTAKAFPQIELTLNSQISNGVVNITNVKTGEKISLAGTFQAGNKIKIDCSKHLVKVNDKLQLNMLSLDSQFFGTVVGANEISCSISGSSLKIIFQERFL